MNKQEILNEIKKVVDSNSKKGKLTTTKFVGTYEYKSGYDTYIAVSYNPKNELVVYSYYQNDRGEHIDTCVYDINEISEKELNEVFENLNTKDGCILDYIEWIHLDDKNQEIIAKLGLYTPKKKKVVVYDIYSIPELENENDAYYVERNGHIGIMKFVARESEELYGTCAKAFYYKDSDASKKVISFYAFKKVAMFDYASRQIKNDNLFTIFSGYEDYSYYKCAFVATKEALINAINDSKTLAPLYMVGYKGKNYIDCRVWKRGEHDASPNFKGFTNEKDAIKYYNTLLDSAKEDIKKWVNEYKTTLEALNAVYKGSKYDAFSKYAIKGKDAKKGNYILVKDDFDRKTYKNFLVTNEITIVKKDKNFTYIADGTVLSDSSYVMTKEGFEKYEKIYNDKENERIGCCITKVEENIKWMERVLSRKHATSFNEEFIYSISGFDVTEVKNVLNECAKVLKPSTVTA